MAFNNNSTFNDTGGYLGLFNQGANPVIGDYGPPNTILGTDSTGVTDYRPLQNAQINPQTISVDRLFASGPQDSSHFLAGNGSWSVPGGAGFSGYGTSGLSISNFIGTSSIDAYSYYYQQIGNVVTVNIRITSVNAYSGASALGQSIAFSLSGLPVTPANYSEFPPANLSISPVNVSTYLTGTDVSKSNAIFTLFWYFNTAVVNADVHLTASFSYRT